MPITPSALRANLYKLIDEVIATGQPLEIARKGVVLTLAPPKSPMSKFDRLPRRPSIVGDPEGLVSPSEHYTWSPDLP
jgi:hypothetical protein